MAAQSGWLARIVERRGEVRALVESLERRHADFVAAAALETNDDEHDPEGATVAFERAQVAALLGQARAELSELGAAEDRIAAGTYGTCEKCGQPIGEGRLEALPAATRCIRCT